MSPNILLLTGDRGVGKTTVCQGVITLAQAAGRTCSGLLTLSSGPHRWVQDVRTGEQRQLTTADGAGTHVGRYVFAPEVLEWGIDVLSRSTPCDLLVVDELGPLEIRRGQGWTVALDVVRGGRFVMALVVVRPELLDEVRRLLAVPVAVQAVTVHNRDRLPKALLGLLTQQQGQPGGCPCE